SWPNWFWPGFRASSGKAPSAAGAAAPAIGGWPGGIGAVVGAVATPENLSLAMRGELVFRASDSLDLKPTSQVTTKPASNSEQAAVTKYGKPCGEVRRRIA